MLYELMPLIYIVIGTGAVIALPDMLGKACGVLLITAALWIIQLRLHYRQQRLLLAGILKLKESKQKEN